MTTGGHQEDRDGIFSGAWWEDEREQAQTEVQTGYMEKRFPCEDCQAVERAALRRCTISMLQGLKT